MSSINGTGAVWPNYSASNVAKAASKDSSVMGKEQFLQLLVAQLKHQDPLTPMDNAQYLGQLTQFSSMEQLMNISEKISSFGHDIGSASSLIGKEVKWSEYASNGNIVDKTGVVDSIISSEGLLYVEVGGQRIGLDFISQIKAENKSSSGNQSSEPTTNNNELENPTPENEEVNE